MPDNFTFTDVDAISDAVRYITSDPASRVTARTMLERNSEIREAAKQFNSEELSFATLLQRVSYVMNWGRI